MIEQLREVRLGYNLGGAMSRPLAGWLTLVWMVVALSGCNAADYLRGAGSGQSDTCSSTGSVNTTEDLVRNQIEKAAIANAASATDAPVTDAAIRAAVNLLKVDISSIRTTKVDPNSTKRFCEAQAKVVVPLNVIADADRVRSLKTATSVNDAATAASVERGADTFTFNIEYDVQPTDDRTQIYSESDSINTQAPFFGAVLVDYIQKPRVEAAMVALQQQQQAAAQAQAQLAQQAEQDALQAAKTDNTLSRQSISAVWTSIEPSTQTQIIDLERSWIKEKVADCKIQAAASSTDPLQVETTRLKCDTAANQQREVWLKQYVPAG